MRVKFSVGWVWLLGLGINPARASLRYALLCLCIFAACSTLRSEDIEEDNFDSEFSEGDENPDSQSEDEELLPEIDPLTGKITLPHPAAPSAIATQNLLYKQRYVNATRLADCAKELRDIAATAQNDADLISASQQLSAKVVKDPTLYHWCFYAQMAEVDKRLRQDRTEPLPDLAKFFLASMSELWILARALEHSLFEPEYFEYLRQRYLALSQSLFGRNLTIVGPALDQPPPAPQPSQKPAGLFFGD